MKKDILFLCQYFYPEYVTSALLPYQTAQELVRSGFTVDVLCGYPREYHSDNGKSVSKKEKVDGITIRRVKYLQLNRVNSLFRLINYFSFVFSCFMKIFSFRHYRLIYVYSNPPILPLLTVLTNYLFKVQFIFVAYDIYPDIAIKTGVLENRSLISRLTEAINKRIYKRCSEIVALSTEMKEYLVAEKKVQPSKIRVIPNWTTEEESVIPNSIETDEVVISYLGNMGIPQDFDMLERIISDKSIRSLPIHFIFAGHGSRKEKLRKFVTCQKLKNVTIYDYLQGDEYKAVLDKSDYHLLSLKKELNGLAVPSKFYSYINNGKPIIALVHEQSDIARDIQEYNLGFSITIDDMSEIKKIFKVISEKKIKHNVLENRHLFEKQVQLKKYVDMTQEVLVRK